MQKKNSSINLQYSKIYPHNSYGYCSGIFSPCFDFLLTFFPSSQSLMRNLGLIDSPLIIDGIRMLSPKDIAPMKLLAINNRGAKKDFYDLYFLFQQFTLDEMYDFYKLKFGSVDPFQIHRSLCFFEDAENRLDNLVPLSNITWEQAKAEIKRIAKCV